MGPPTIEEGGVASAVESITSLYRRSSATLSTLKAACAARRIPPPPNQLDDAIDSAVVDIEKELKKSIRRFGSDFEDGDEKTTNALAEVERELRTGLFVKVRFATFSESEDLHGPELVDTADWARDKTMYILTKFKQSLWQNAAECPSAQRKASVASTQSHGKKSVDMGPKKTFRENSMVGSMSGDEDTASGAEDPRTRKRNASLLGLFKHHRTTSKDGSYGDAYSKQSDIESRRQSQALQTSPTSTPSAYGPQVDAQRSASISTTSTSTSGHATKKDSVVYSDWREQLAKIEQNSSAHDRHDSSATVRASSPAPGEKLRHSSTGTSFVSQKVPSRFGSVAIPTPTPENNYLGLCKSAVRLQNGDKKGALEKRKEFNDGWSQSSVYFLACSSNKCCFAGHVNLDFIWTKALTSNQRGLKFRWGFLAKSHVSQSKVQQRQYQFYCLFCLYVSGNSTTYHGTDCLLDHVSSQHRGEALSPVVLYKTQAINDRVCEDGDDFDINLFPLDSSSPGSRKQSTWSDDLRLGRSISHQSTASASDSVMGKVEEEEPWNAGLSEFHMKDEFE